MKLIYRLLCFLFLSASLFSCQKELGFEGTPDNPIITPGPTPVLPDPVTANLQGTILNENGVGEPGVTVTVGSKTATTDANGYFRIFDAQLDRKTSLVVAEKTGYFKGMRIFQATSGANNVMIKLTKKVLVGTIAATAGGDATLANGGKVTLPAGGIVKAANDSAYTGDVNVYAAYIDPSSNDIGITVPGSFMAEDKDGNRVMMTSYGMMAVELQSTSGEKLQIKSGATATLTTPIPASGTSSAPATISLWAVDEQTGLWKEEGTATKQGNKYVGQVSHFSFWNCDVASNYVTLTVTVQTTDSIPMVHVPVKITRSGTGWQTTGWGWTDSLGMVSGIVPPNETLILEVLDPCWNTAYSMTINPITQNTDLGIIYVPNNMPLLVTFEGTLLNCSGTAVTNGYAIITYNNMVRYASVDTGGHYQVSFFSCSGVSGTATVIGIDQGAQQQSNASTVAVTAPVTSAGNITACGTSSVQFINYTLDGTSYSITSTNNDSLTGYFYSQGTTANYVAIMGNQNPAGGSDNISFTVMNPTGVGTFPLMNLFVQTYRSTSAPGINLTFTNYANTVGEYYEGSFSGSFVDSSITHTINTTFRVRRVQ